MNIKFTDDSFKNIIDFIDIQLGTCSDFTPEEKKKDLYIAMLIFAMAGFANFNMKLDSVLQDKVSEILKFLSDNNLIQITVEE